MKRLHLNRIEQLLKEDLPGWDAQRQLSPIATREYLGSRKDARLAGVNLLLYPDDQDELKMLFIKRPNNNPNDKHGGQISFPGGQMESQDENLIQTALRETEEEVGVPSSHMKVLGTLSPLYVFVSNFKVQPIVSYIDSVPELQLQKSEVDYVLSENLKYFTEASAVHRTDFKVRDIIMKDMPYYNLQNHILWGATAMITAEFVEIIKAI